MNERWVIFFFLAALLVLGYVFLVPANSQDPVASGSGNISVPKLPPSSLPETSLIPVEIDPGIKPGIVKTPDLVQESLQKARTTPVNLAAVAENVVAENTHNPSEARSNPDVVNWRDKVEAIQIDGITIDSVRDDKGTIDIAGSAESNRHVSTYMRQLDSDIGPPELNFLKKENRSGGSVATFSISVKPR